MRPQRPIDWCLATAAGIVIVSQAVYPLFKGAARHDLTIVFTCVFSSMSLGHSLVWRGPRFTAWLLAVTVLGGLAVEAVGIRTGFPFAAYSYNGTLGWKLLGVPLVVPLGWTMMGYTAHVVGQTIAAESRWAVVISAWALTAWDLLLEPLMVREQHWIWSSTAPAVAGIPVTNFTGWFGTALLMMTVLAAVAPSPAGADDTIPHVMYVWVFISLLFANVVIWRQPAFAVAGGVGMGAVVAALLATLLRPPRLALGPHAH